MAGRFAAPFSAAAWLLALCAATGCGSRTELRVPPTARDASLDTSDALDALDASDASDALDTAPDTTPDTAPDVPPPPDCRVTPSLCEDHNACTRDSCGPDGVCAHGAVVCVDDDPCTADRCDPSVGCVFPLTECGGCADGQREAFGSRARYPDIAGCAGGFAVPGLARDALPSCARAAGDDGPNPTGLGCTAADLCAPGWHVCRSAGDVSSHSTDGCTGANDAPMDSFFATRQTGPGCFECATGTSPGCGNASCRSDCAPDPDVTNDLFGCGTAGASARASCAPLNRASNDLCSDLPAPWSCDAGPGSDVHESDVVTKRGAAGGGVLCCRD